jgi:hypothetical protein
MSTFRRVTTATAAAALLLGLTSAAPAAAAPVPTAPQQVSSIGDGQLRPIQRLVPVKYRTIRFHEIARGSRVTTQYRTSGVVFTAAPAPKTIIDTRYSGGSGLALDTAVSTDRLYGVADMTFTRPGLSVKRSTRQVTFTLWTPEIHDTPDNVRITAYNAAGRVILNRTAYLGTGTTRHTLTAPSSSTGINRVRITVLVGGDTVYLDNLTTWAPTR